MRSPKFIFLIGVRSEEECKRVYREKALKLHPDKGGNVEDMQQLNAEYQYAIKVKMWPLFNATIRTNTHAFTRETQERARREAARREAERREEQERVAKKQNDEFVRKAREAAERQKREQEKAKPEVLDYELFKSMLLLMVETAKNSGKKLGSVWFNYVEFLQANNLKTTKRQLEYIGAVLGYAQGWAYFKYEELKKIKLVV